MNNIHPLDWPSPSDCFDRYKLLVSIAPEPALQRPSNASPPSIGFAALAGTYNNPGYGKFELCLVSTNNTAATKSCKALAAKLPTILPGVVLPNVPTLLAEFDSPIASHIRITHYNQNTFNVSGLTSYVSQVQYFNQAVRLMWKLPSPPQATGNPAEPFWVSGDPAPFDSGIYAEVGTDNGRIGISVTGIWGAGAGVPSPQGKTPRERAEVWFSKL